MTKIIQCFRWIKVNIKIVLFSFCVGIVMIFCAWGIYKNKRVSILEQKVALLAAKLELEKVLVQYNISMDNLHALREKDEKIGASLRAIEESLLDRLPANMTPEEIAAKFREIGL
jgi:hypothetical protein